MGSRTDALASEAAIEASRRRRRGVAALEAALRVGTALLLTPRGQRRGLVRRLGITTEQARRCIILVRADERGLLASETPMTLAEAEIAAGIRT